MELLAKDSELETLREKVARLERDLAVERSECRDLRRQLAAATSRVAELEQKAMSLLEAEYGDLVRAFEAGKSFDAKVILGDTTKILGRS